MVTGQANGLCPPDKRKCEFALRDILIEYLSNRHSFVL
jgi:hypothetical protein